MALIYNGITFYEAAKVGQGAGGGGGAATLSGGTVFC